MKIIVNQVPAEGLLLKEKIKSAELDLDTELIKFGPEIFIQAYVQRITNALTIKINISALMYANCSRCLNEFERQFNREVDLNFPLDKDTVFIDLNPIIREEVILDYPIKPLCKATCQGLCAKCGKNKNEGGCNCGST